MLPTLKTGSLNKVAQIKLSTSTFSTLRTTCQEEKERQVSNFTQGCDWPTHHASLSPFSRWFRIQTHQIWPLHNTLTNTKQMSFPRNGLEQILFIEQLCPRWQGCGLPATPAATGGLTKASSYLCLVFLRGFLPYTFWEHYLGQGEYS